MVEQRAVEIGALMKNSTINRPSRRAVITVRADYSDFLPEIPLESPARICQLLTHISEITRNPVLQLEINRASNGGTMRFATWKLSADDRPRISERIT